MMRHKSSRMRKVFCFAISAWLLALGFYAEAQQSAEIPRIGWVSESGDRNTPGPQVEAFRQGLLDLGYVEGKNMVVEYRYAEGKTDRIPGLVAELVQLKVDVIVVTNPPAVREAKQATKTIPIVMVTVQDPVATGLIDSMARPGGNITGLVRLTVGLSEKRMELLKQVLPELSRGGVLWDAGGSGVGVKGYESAAAALNLKFQSLEIHGPTPGFDGAFQAASKAGVGAVITVTGGQLNRYPKSIADLALKHSLPSMFERHPYVEAGGLFSYAPNNAEITGRGILHRQDSHRCQVRRPARRATDEIRVRDQSQDGETDSVNNTPNVLARADRVIR